MTVTVPPEPYSIYWDNLHSSAVNKMCFILALIFFVLVLYACLIFLTITLQDEFESLDYTAYCPK